MADWNPVINKLRLSCGLRLSMAALALAVAAGCASNPRGTVPAGTAEPDKFLFDKGTDALNNKKWITSREFFKQVTETYTASPYRPDAKLGIGDTYLGEGSAEALVLAINEYTEFLSFYPTNRRADYAQYKLGMAHFRQMRLPQRDQTETRAALREFDTFIARYPGSSLMEEVQGKRRETRDRLSEADYQVGYFYYRQKWYPGLDRSLQAGAQGRSGLHRARQRLFLSRRFAGEGEEGRRGAPLSRKAGAGVREERASRAGAEDDHRSQGAGSQTDDLGSHTDP